jgi:hypothetical protein
VQRTQQKSTAVLTEKGGEMEMLLRKSSELVLRPLSAHGSATIASMGDPSAQIQDMPAAEGGHSDEHSPDEGADAMENSQALGVEGSEGSEPHDCCEESSSCVLATGWGAPKGADCKEWQGVGQVDKAHRLIKQLQVSLICFKMNNLLMLCATCKRGILDCAYTFHVI